MAVSSRSGACVWLHERSRYSELELDRCRQRLRERSFCVPDRIWRVLYSMDISLFFLHCPFEQQFCDRPRFHRHLWPNPICLHEFIQHEGNIRRWSGGSRNVTSCLMEVISLDKVVAAVASLDLRPGHSVLVVNAETGLANQVAAHLIGPESVNIGVTSPSLLPQCRLLTDVIRRSQPAWETSATLPIFTATDVYALSKRKFDRILILTHCTETASRMRHHLASDGVMIASRICRSEVLLVRHQRRPDGSFRVEDIGTTFPNANIIVDALQFERSGSPPSLLRLTMEKIALSFDPLGQWRHAQDSSIVRGFYFCSNLTDARQVASTFAQLTHEWARLSSTDCSSSETSSSLLHIYHLCNQLAIPMARQVSHTAETLIQASLAFLNHAIISSEFFEDSFRSLHQELDFPKALRCWLSSDDCPQISSPVHKSLEEMLVRNAARMVSDVEAIRMLISSTAAPLILNEPAKFSHWAADYSAFVLNSVKQSQPLSVERPHKPPIELPALSPSPFHLLYCEGYNYFENSGIFVPNGYNEDSFRIGRPLLASNYSQNHHLSRLDTTQMCRMRNDFKAPKSELIGMQITLDALIESIKTRVFIRLNDGELQSLRPMDVETSLSEEIYRLNKTIPDAMSFSTDVYRFLASRVHEDLCTLIEYLRYYCAEMQYCALANNHSAYFKAACETELSQYITDMLIFNEEIPRQQIGN